MADNGQTGWSPPPRNLIESGRSVTGPHLTLFLLKKGPNSIDVESHCTFTASPDDKLFGLFKRKSGDIAAGTGGQGKLELLGGTGKYSGITGACPYKTNYMPQNNIVTFAHCDWNK